VYVQTGCVPFFCVDSLVRISSDGTGQTYLRTGGTEPNWSPLGDKIAFTDEGTICSSDANGFQTCNSQIFTTNPDGIGRTRITDDTTSDSEANWSPDGSKIVFSTNRHVEENCFFRDCNTEIYVMNADGSGQTRLTNSPTVDESPAWSPDGKKIVFTSFRDDPDVATCISCESEIYVMNADGSNQTRLTNTPTQPELEPDWQPLPGPQRSEYKNAAQFCKAERDFLGDEGFRNRYGGGANAYGKCVSDDGR
jgi:TolB protein